MECLLCKGKMELSKAPFDVERKGYHIHFNALPAWVCSQCGEAYFESETVSKIEKAIGKIEEELNFPPDQKLDNVA